MNAKIFENRAKKAADWRSENLGNNLQNDLGSLPSRSTGFARPGCGGGGWPKKYDFTQRANRPQGPQSKQTKTKRRDHNTLFNKSLRSRKSIENCSVWWFSLRCVLVAFGGARTPVRIYNSFCNSLPASKTAHV